MKGPKLSRRDFFRSAAAGAALAGVGTWATGRAWGANERLAIGAIGTGGRGLGALMTQVAGLAKNHNAEIIAVCDVWQPNLRQAAAKCKDWFGKEPQAFTRFGDLLALKDVDAVLIATCDSGHTPILIEALKAGKDAYVEKPMSITIEEATQALDLARAKERVVQVGTQRRSEGRWVAIRDELKTGILGQITRVSAGVYFNEPRWARGFADCKEQDVDWDAYLFNRAKRPFDPKLLRRWHLYKDFTNGLSGLWMSHYVDAMHLLMGCGYPASAVSHGGTYHWKDGREHADTFLTLIEYPEGFLFDWGMGLANAAGAHFTVHGTEGTLDTDTLALSPTGGPKTSKVPAKKLTSPPNQDHMANWLECLRSRKRPSADIEFGHMHSVAGILAAEALFTGRRQVYDPKARTITAG